MKARVYALHERLLNESMGMPTRAAATKDDAKIKTASIIITENDGSPINHTMEVSVGVLGGDPEIGDEYEVFFGHNLREQEDGEEETRR